MKLNSRFASSLAAVAAVLVSAGCGGGSGSGSTAGTFTVDGVVQDAPIDDLSSFSATVDEVRLVTAGGTTTANLVDDSVSVEWLGLQNSGAWLFSERPPQGTFTSVRIVLDPSSIVARDASGSTVSVTAVSTTVDAPLTTPLTVGPSGYARLVIDLDLSESLTGDVGSPPITFDPAATVSTSNGGTPYGIDEFDGVVRSVDEAQSSLVVEAYVDDDLEIPLGLVEVQVPANAVLVDDDDTFYADRAAFFADLTVGSTVLEIEGDLISNSTVTAESIEVEDQNGGANSSGAVKIEGRVQSIAAGTSFDLVITEIEKGLQIAGPVLGGLGSPGVITVTFDGSTVFVDESYSTVTSAALQVGQEVDVRFESFTGAPFLASWVEVDDAPDHDAIVQDASGAPNSIVVRLRPGEDAITSGLVQSSSTDVTVDLSSASVELDVEGDPAFDPAALIQGLRVEIEGAIGGTPAAPTIAASHVEVGPGEFEGAVSGANPGASTFDATVFSIEDPFGFNVTSPPFTVIIDPSCVFEEGATSQAGFFALFAGLAPGETLEVEVEGVGTGNANEIRAFEIEVEVDDD